MHTEVFIEPIELFNDELGATSRQSSFYGYGSGKIWLDKLNCTGSEATLMDCPRGVKVGDAVCDYTDIAGAFCPCEWTSSCI